MTGPVVRINPDEVHVNLPEFYETLYGGSATRRDKWYFTARAFRTDRSMFGTVPHDLHRMRRGVLGNYFSKKSVTMLEPMIKDLVENMCSRFRQFQQTKMPINLCYAFGALTLDVITSYSFGQSYDAVNAVDFDPKWMDTANGLANMMHFGSHFGWMFPIFDMFPDSIMAKTNPLFANLVNYQAVSNAT